MVYFSILNTLLRDNSRTVQSPFKIYSNNTPLYGYSFFFLHQFMDIFTIMSNAAENICHKLPPPPPFFVRHVFISLGGIPMKRIAGSRGLLCLFSIWVVF